MLNEVLTVDCPACGQPSRYAADNPHRPFCCARCKNLDFGAWASERFRLQSEALQCDEIVEINSHLNDEH